MKPLRLNIYIDYVDPPGALAIMWDSQANEGEMIDRIMVVFLCLGLHIAARSLHDQIVKAGRVARGPKPAEEYISEWRKRAEPFAVVSVGNGLYLLCYKCPLHHKTPLEQQGWRYLKTALDVVSDDFRNGNVKLNIAGLERYKAELPVKIIKALAALPKLTFK